MLLDALPPVQPNAPSLPRPFVEHRVKLRNANEMMLPLFLMRLRFGNFNALLCRPLHDPELSER